MKMDKDFQVVRLIDFPPYIRAVKDGAAVCFNNKDYYDPVQRGNTWFYYSTEACNMIARTLIDCNTLEKVLKVTRILQATKNYEFPNDVNLIIRLRDIYSGQENSINGHVSSYGKKHFSRTLWKNGIQFSIYTDAMRYIPFTRVINNGITLLMQGRIDFLPRQCGAAYASGCFVVGRWRKNGLGRVLIKILDELATNYEISQLIATYSEELGDEEYPNGPVHLGWKECGSFWNINSTNRVYHLRYDTSYRVHEEDYEADYNPEEEYY